MEWKNTHQKERKKPKYGADRTELRLQHKISKTILYIFFFLCDTNLRTKDKIEYKKNSFIELEQTLLTTYSVAVCFVTDRFECDNGG